MGILIALIMACESAILAQGRIDPKELATFLDSILAEHQQQVPGAAISVVQDGTVILEKGYGFADLEKRVPVRPQATLFRIASVSKSITATAVMQLVERGQLRLDADVNTYLRRFKVPATYPTPITLAHLLTHTAGFDEVAAFGYVSEGQDVEPLGQHLAWRMPRRVMPPGGGESYSNYSFALAGHIVEEVSGLSFGDYIDRYIFQPLGMRRSTFQQPVPAALANDLARSYGTRTEPLPSTFPQAVPSGGMSTTVHDMGRFLNAQLEGGEAEGARILSSESVKQMHAKQFSPHPKVWGSSYGFGEDYRQGQRIISKGGGGGGFTSRLVLLPEHRLGYFLACTSFDPEGKSGSALHFDVLRRFVEHYFPNRPVVARISPGPDAAAGITRIAGTYRWNRYPRHEPFKIIAMAFEQAVTTQGDGVLRVGPTEWVEVEPLLFRRVDAEEYMVFRESPRGEIVQMLTGDGSYDKLAWYETRRLHMGLASGFILLFVSTVIVSVIAFARRRSRSRSEVVAVATFLGVATLNLVFVISFVTLRLVMQWDVLFGMPRSLVIVLCLPLLTLVLTMTLPVFLNIAWKRRWWSLPRRVYYSLVTAAALGFLVFLQYWNLIGIQY